MITKRAALVACWVALATFGFFIETTFAGPAASYLQSARKLEKANDLRGAEIQLRNASQAEPGNSEVRIELARVYLALGNPNAAEAELFAAHWRGANEEAAAPLMAQAMLEKGEFGELLKNVPTGNRSKKTESLVRAYRGMAELALNEPDKAETMFADASRLDPKSVLPLLGEARLLMQQKKYAAAQQKANEALKLDPKNSDARDMTALALAAQGHVDEAVRQLGQLIADNPRNFRARLDRANLELQRGKVDLAESDIAAVRKLAPGNIMVMFLQAMIDTQRKKYKDADALFDRLRGIMSSFPTAYLAAAEVKMMLGQTEQAESLANKYVAQVGNQPGGYELLGMIALKRGNVSGATAMLEKAVKLAPNDTNALAMLGQAYVAQGDLDKAKVVFNEAALKAPGNSAIATQHALTDFATGDREAGLSELNAVFKGGKGNLAAGPPLVLEALQSGRLDTAASAANALVTRDPKNSTYQELLAMVKVAQHDFPAAEKLLSTLLARDPNLVSARRDLAQIYLQTHRVAEAKNLYQDRLKSNPSDIETMMALADIAFREKNDAAAIQWLNQAQARTPANPRPSLQILAILEVRKRWPDAINRAHALRTRFPKEAAVYDALAHLYFESGDRSTSLSEYKQATAKFPNSAPLFAHYAAVLAANKDYMDAAAATARAVHLDPKNLDLKRAFVTLTYKAKDAGAALSASRSVFTDKTTAVLVASDVLEAANNESAAVSLLESAQAQNPSGAVLSKLAMLYQKIQEPNKGIAVLEQWTKSHPDDFEPRFALALLCSGAGRLDQARAQYEWLVAKRPNNPVILNNLAWLYSLNHDARARATAEKALSLQPNSGSIADTLGWILANSGDTAAALKYLRQANEKQPTDGTIQYHLAFALAKSGNSKDARALLENVVASRASTETLSAARALLVSLKSAH